MLTCVQERRGGQGHAISRKTTAKAYRTQMLKEKEAVTHRATHFQDQARLELCTAVVAVTTA